MDHPSEKIVHLEKKSLKRAVGAAELFSVGYGDVGSSLYYALGLTALYALGATPLALAIAGFIFICTCFTYAEMSTTFPEPGGSATFSRHAFNDLVSFIAGWALLLDYIVTIAISAFAIPPYFRYFLPFSDTVLVQTISTIGIIAFLYVLNFFGVKYSGKFSFILALLTVLSQFAVVLVAAILVMNLPFIISHLKVGVAGASWSPSWPDFAKGVAMAMVAYTGIESISQLAAETRKPALSIPRAIKWTMVLLVTLYLLISVVGLSVIDPKELGTQYVNEPIAGIISKLPFGGNWLASWFGLIAAMILLLASNAGLIGASRLTFSLGEHYQVPHFLYRIHSKFRTPYISLAVFSFLAAFIVILSRGRMPFLADLYNFGAQIAFFFAHLSLLVLRWKKPQLQRPFRAPLNIPLGKGRSVPLTALIGAPASLFVWSIVVSTKPEGRNLGLLWLIGGLIMYLYYRKKKQIAPLGSLQIEKIRIPEYHPMHLKHILVTAREFGNAEALQTACLLAKNFHAKLTAVHILEIPPSLPMDAPLEKREAHGEAALKRAEAIARESHISINLKLIRARSIEQAILDLATPGEYDMIVIGTKKRESFTLQMEKLLKSAPCRVLYCKS